ncbi:MAG: ORF6N domain-containing protein [Planctomycetes bacterium]|nr:ORF6N domain-containing protein [Planctomycetota bacterium]
MEVWWGIACIRWGRPGRYRRCSSRSQSNPSSRESALTGASWWLRGHRVVLDPDLAKLYGVTTKRLNEQGKRNPDRFPEDFMFQLTAEEKAEVVADCDHLSRLRFSPVRPGCTGVSFPPPPCGYNRPRFEEARPWHGGSFRSRSRWLSPGPHAPRARSNASAWRTG